MSNNRPSGKGLAEQNYHKKDEDKDTRGGVTGEGQELSEEDELQINDDIDGASGGQMETVQVQSYAHIQTLLPRTQPHPKESVVRWERFLPLRSLKVLLVEDDDSTRHVVSALLQNCGYEVTDVADGNQAWKILEDLTNQIDLVLTELSVPFLSGIALLSRIMQYKSRKNIPVIMMSSHGTIGVVFKCLSKGAVDFLVKPIRKNELKNLWQHVWRKCHSQSSGCGSKSGTQTQKSDKLRSGKSDNNTGSNDDDDNESVGLNVRDGSDNGSGTQSSWTKRAIEIDSPQKTSTWDQLPEPLDRTCSLVIRLRPEAFSSNWVPISATGDPERQDAENDNDVMGRDLEIGVPRNSHPQPDAPKKMTSVAGNSIDKDSKLDDKRNEDPLELNQSDPESEKTQGELQNKAVDLLGSIAIVTSTQMETKNLNTQDGLSKALDAKDNVVHGDKEMPSLELSLKRTRDLKDIEKTTHDRNILRHSGISAFSKYISTSTTNEAPTGVVGSCSPDGNSSEAAKTESVQNLQFNSNSSPPNQGSNGGSNGSSDNNDVGSTTNDVVKVHRPCSAFQPVDSSRIFPTQPAAQCGSKADAATGNMTSGQPWDAKQRFQFHHHHHHHHHHYHRINDQEDAANASALQCGSSNMLVEGGAPNLSLNGSASGSNHAVNNGQNRSSNPLISEEMDADGNNNMTTKCGYVAGIEHFNRSSVDQNRNAQREAALNKFRQKRKERCFEKKVRYHSRKKLAEQRPRIRGQFVRQKTNCDKNAKDPS